MSFIWLLPTIKFKSEGANLLLFDQKTALRIDGLGVHGANFLGQLDGTRQEQFLVTSPVAATLLPLLDQHGWLVRLKRDIRSVIKHRAWISRQLSYYAHLTQNHPDSILDDLSRATALIIGAGGIGSHVAYSLAAAGVGNLIITDKDTIEESNLNRQFLYHREDIGNYKAPVVAENIRTRFPPINILSIVVDYDSTPIATELPQADIVVMCGEVSSLLDNSRLVGETAFLVAGYLGAQGVVGPLLCPARGTPCLQCVMTNAGRKDVRELDFEDDIRMHGWNSSASTINGVVGNLAAEVVMHSLSNSLNSPLCLNETILINMRTLELTREPVPIIKCKHSR